MSNELEKIVDMSKQLDAQNVLAFIALVRRYGISATMSPSDPLNPRENWDIILESHEGRCVFHGISLMDTIKFASDPSNWTWKREWTKTRLVNAKGNPIRRKKS